MNIEWMDMVYYQRQVQKLARLLLPAGKTNLTVSECELLAWLYLEREQNTPVLLRPAQRNEKRSGQPLSEESPGKKLHPKGKAAS